MGQKYKIRDMTKLKAFADDGLNVDQMVISVFGRKCWLLAVSPFPGMFSKGFLLEVFCIWDRVIES